MPIRLEDIWVGYGFDYSEPNTLHFCVTPTEDDLVLTLGWELLRPNGEVLRGFEDEMKGTTDGVIVPSMNIARFLKTCLQANEDGCILTTESQSNVVTINNTAEFYEIDGKFDAGVVRICGKMSSEEDDGGSGEGVDLR